MSRDSNTEKKGYQYPDHHPVTRRQFLALGVSQAASVLLVPDLLNLLKRTSNGVALASECDVVPSDMCPFLVFDCIGGASLAGNFVVGKKGGAEDFLKAYDTMGVPTSPASSEPIDNAFGAPLYTKLSKLREGLTGALSPTTAANLRMATICNSSQDDSGENQLSPAILVGKAGLTGKYFKSGLSLLGTDSGGNSKSPVVDATLRPVTIRAVTDVSSALSFGPGLSSLSGKQKASIGQALSSLSEGQLEKLRQMNAGEQFRTMARCGYLRSIEFASPVAGVIPSQDPVAQGVFGGQVATPAAGVIYNALQKNAGPGIVGISGCDYHDGTQTTGDAKDLEIGRLVGMSVELASKMGSPLFFAIISDGSTYSDLGTRIWRGDAGTKGLAVIGYFDPKGPVSMRRTQIGQYTDGQVVDRDTYIGTETRRVPYAILANYLNVHGKLGMFSSLAQLSDFDPSQVDSHLAFA